MAAAIAVQPAAPQVAVCRSVALAFFLTVNLEGEKKYEFQRLEYEGDAQHSHSLWVSAHHTAAIRAFKYNSLSQELR